MSWTWKLKFSLPPGIRGSLSLLLEALPGLFCLPFYLTKYFQVHDRTRCCIAPVSGPPTAFAYCRIGPAVLAAGAGRIGCIAFLFNIFHLSSRSNVMSFGRQLNKIERVWFRLVSSNSS